MRAKKEIFELSPLDYVQYVKRLNVNYLEKIQNKLDPVYNLVCENDCCVTIAGSDGKEERHPQSKHEVEFLVPPDTNKAKFSRSILDSYKQKNKGDFPAEFGAHNELPIVRSVGNPQDVLSYAYNQPDLAYPDRILNSKLVLGSNEIYRQARIQVLQEFLTTFKESRRIYDRTSGQLRDYIKVLNTGVYRNISVLNENEGWQFYDENDEQLSYGFKIPLLRTFQRRLDLLTMKLLRTNKNESDLKDYSEHLATELPTNTCERINYFSNLLKMPDNYDYQYSYAWSQREYHRAQERYKSERVPVRVNFDRDEFWKCRESLSSFLKVNFLIDFLH